jgi:4-amino-4-deoxy-L-arabinose transferase-like glycosyltransferase
VAALGLVAVVLASGHFKSADPDSALHASLAARLAALPVSRWIAPRWWGQWDRTDLYREHPAGIFLLPAALARLGYPPEQAAYLVNAVYQVITFVLIEALALRLVSRREARSLAWILQLLPVAFVYRIRANHEQALLCCVLAALYGTERSRTKPAWAVLTVSGVVALLLIKGVLAVMALAMCVVWVAIRRGGDDAGGTRRTWVWPVVGVLAAAASALAFTLIYDHVYRQVTGEPFVVPYLTQQLGLASIQEPPGVIGRKLVNFLWYCGRVLWYALPWSVLLLAMLPSARKRLLLAQPASRQAMGLTLALALVYVGLFSLSDRTADRYIFPAYFFVGAAGAIAGLRSFPRLERLVDRVRAAYPYEVVGLFVLTFLLAWFSAVVPLPRVRFHF